jgi:hypothetical protein
MMALMVMEVAKDEDQVLQLGKKIEKNKNGLKSKLYLIGPFLFY